MNSLTKQIEQIIYDGISEEKTELKIAEDVVERIKQEGYTRATEPAEDMVEAVARLLYEDCDYPLIAGYDNALRKYPEKTIHVRELARSILKVCQPELKERLPIDKDYNLLDALKLIRKCIRNSRSAPNIIDTIDSVASEAIHQYFEWKQPQMGGDTSISSVSTGEGRMP